MYIDNQSIGKDVWFDNVHVEHYTSEVLEEDHYYPFGLTLSSDAGAGLTPNQYKYNSKELQTEFNLQYYDYGARMYNSQIGRWNGIDPLAEQNRRWSPFVYALNNPIRYIDADGMTNYYNLKGKMVKHIEDGNVINKFVLTSSQRDNAVDNAINNGEIAAVPSNEAISKMDAAYTETERTGNEYGFVVAKDGSTSSLTTSNSGEEVKIGSAYNELSNSDKVSEYDVHTHPNGKNDKGEIVNVGLPSPSGTNGGTPDKEGDTDSYGTHGANSSPSVVLGYSVTKYVTKKVDGSTKSSTTVTRQVGFYNSKGQVGKPVDYNKIKKAALKINKN